jgi:hypothetical protein
MRQRYATLGARKYYETSGGAYRNPHEAAVRKALQCAVRRWPLDLESVLDLACGSGEVTLTLAASGCRRIEGIDPYTHQAYRQRTGRVAETFTFEQIADGCLAGRRYSLIICSYALHLLSPSRLPGVLVQLALIAPSLLVITPHKRPEISPDWGWKLREELAADRVKARWYQSTCYRMASGAAAS